MKVREIVLNALYCIDGEYVPFPENPLHGKKYENIDVTFSREAITICDIAYFVDKIEIEGEEPIECKLVSQKKSSDGKLVVQFCQDWG